MIKGSTIRLRVYRSTIAAAAAAAALVSSNVGLAPVASATPQTPHITSAVPGNGSVTLNWTPASGQTSSGWTIIYIPVGGGSSKYDYNVSGDYSATSETTTGLTNGQQYTAYVEETIQSGATTVDSPGVLVTPGLSTAPAAPTGVTGSADDSSVDLSWTAPDDGGSAITGYTIAYTDTTNGAGSGTYSPSGTGTTATVPSLTPGDHYTFTVAAINTVGTGTASAASGSVTPYTAPGAPTGVTATGGDASAAVSWTAPAADGFTPITDYEINYTDTSNAAGDGSFDTSGTATSATVPNLVNGDIYTFTVVATNAADDGPASSPSTGVLVATTPAAPTGVTATTGTNLATANQVTVGWTAPTDSGGLPITGYTISYTDTTTVGHNGTFPSPGIGTSAVVTGLRAGDVYTFTVSATNNRGTGSPSSASSGSTPVNVPGTPTGISASAGPGGSQGTLHWTAPAAHGSAITTYTIEAIDTSDSSGNSDQSTTVAAPATSGTVGGLVPGDIYTLRVIATNAIGDSVPSHASNIITPFTTPDTPTSVSASGGDGSADLSWSAPDNGGSAITGYLITYTDADHPGNNGTYTSTGSGTSATVPGLVGGESYTFTVAAINAAGTGSASDPSGSVDVVSAPDAPTGVSGTAGPAGSEATVTWTAPTNTGGSAITGYTVTLDDGVDPVITVNAGSGDSSAVVDGLVPGADYTVTVTATNAIGTSSAGSAGDPVTAYTTPDAPTGVSGSRGNGSVDLTWTAPADGGSPITDYVVTYTDTTNAGGSGSFDTLGTSTSATVPSLTNGDSYTFTVTATNAAGDSNASDPSSVVTPATTPGVVTAVTAVADSSSVDLSWDAPASDGGSPITGYLVTCTDTSASASPSASPSETDSAVRPLVLTPDGELPITSTSTTVTGLIPGDSYTCTVVAVNDVGSGSDSDPSNSVTPFTTADAPTGVTATADSSSADLSWTAPGSDGGSAITDYVITYTDTSDPAGDGTYDTLGTSTSATVPSLIPGDSYTFVVTAINTAGNGTDSDATAAVTPYTTPDAPTAVTGTRENASVDLTWTAPADGGSPITDYVITYTDTSNAAGDGSYDTLGTSTSATVPSLTNGDSYTFTVTAINTAGDSSASDPSSSVTPATTPDAPTAISANADSSSVDLSWDAPGADGGSAITDYVITYTDTSDPAGDGTYDTLGTGTSAIVPSLIPGDSYTFTVAATNDVGNSSASDPSSSVSPYTTPDAPTGVTATADSSSADLSWTAPADGGSAITGYVITYTDTSNAAGDGGYNPTGTGTTATVPDLIPGDSYTFTVTAINTAGYSAASDPSSSVTVYTTPDAPTGVTGTRENASVDLTWTAPADGDSPITDYTISYVDNDNLLGSGSYDTSGTATSATVPGLVNGDSYTFTVTAVNAAGSGNSSDPSSAVTPATTPEAPSGLTVAADSSSAELSWDAPGADGGSAITDYVITYTDTSDPAGDGTYDTLGTGTSAIVPSLIPGDSYTFTVAAVNDVGTGSATDPSSSVSPYTTPDAPTGVTATADSSSADLSWTAPGSDGGNSITGYVITYTDTSDASGDGVYNPSGTGTTATVPDLVPGDNYTFVVTAINLAGNGADSDPSTAVSPYTTADAPTSVSGSRGNGSVDLTWTAPINDGGSAITDYVITYTDTSSVLGSGSFDTLGTSTSATVPSLVNGDSYTFTVTAVNAAGSGTASDPSSAVTPATTPDAPTGVTATADSSSADVTWTAPSDNGGSPVTGYTITYVDTDNALGDGSYSPSGTATSTTVPSLIPGDHYTFTVTATNSVGDGSASGSSGAVQIFTISDAPTGVTAAVGPHGAPVISFTAPVNTGFTPITGYTVVYGDITHPAGLQVLTGVSGSPVTVTGLRAGDQYQFGVIANNAAGASDFSAPSNTITVFSAPGAPTAVTATAGTSSMTARWTAPTVTGGSPITGYTVTYTDRTNPAHTVVHHVGGGALSDQATVIPGESYSVSVTATNLYGTGSASPGTAARTPYTLPSAPSGLTATAGNGTAALRWAAPASDGYSPITGYRITVTDRTTGATRVALVGVRVGAIVGGLTNGDSYTFTVAAVNAAGASAPSRASAAVTPIVPLTLRSATLLPDVGVGLSATLAPFSVTLNRPGAISVALVEGATVIDSTTVAAGGTTVSGNVRMNITKLSQLGTYSWVVRDASNGAVLGRSSVTLKQNAFLAIVATRKGSSIDVLGVAKWASLTGDKVLPYAGKAIDIQRFTAGGWVTIGTRTADAKGHINLTLTIAQRVGLRLVIGGTPVVIGVTSNVNTL